MRSVLVLARYSLVEAWRSGLPWLALASLATCLGLAIFVSDIAITEVAATRTAIAAAFLRTICVLLVAAHAVTATVRDYNDRVIELSLSLPLSRSAYYLGRLLGFIAVGFVLSAVMGLPLLAAASPSAALTWTAFLALECAVVASAAFFFSISLATTVPALAATVALYVLARAMPSIKAMAESPLAGGEGPAMAFGRPVLDTVALLLPRLDAAARSEWLLYGLPASSDLLTAFAGLIVYSAMLAAAGMFDFHRRNL